MYISSKWTEVGSTLSKGTRSKSIIGGPGPTPGSFLLLQGLMWTLSLEVHPTPPHCVTAVPWPPAGSWMQRRMYCENNHCIPYKWADLGLWARDSGDLSMKPGLKGTQLPLGMSLGKGEGQSGSSDAVLLKCKCVYSHLFKYRFWFIRAKVGLRFCISAAHPAAAVSDCTPRSKTVMHKPRQGSLAWVSRRYWTEVPALGKDKDGGLPWRAVLSRNPQPGSCPPGNSSLLCTSPPGNLSLHFLHPLTAPGPCGAAAPSLVGHWPWRPAGGVHLLCAQGISEKQQVPGGPIILAARETRGSAPGSAQPHLPLRIAPRAQILLATQGSQDARVTLIHQGTAAQHVECPTVRFKKAL